MRPRVNSPPPGSRSSRSLRPNARRCISGAAVRVVEPFTGATFELYGRMREFSDPFVPRLAKIQRIGHVVMRVPDFDDGLRVLHARAWASASRT